MVDRKRLPANDHVALVQNLKFSYRGDVCAALGELCGLEFLKYCGFGVLGEGNGGSQGGLGLIR